MRRAFADAPADCLTRVPLVPLSEGAVQKLALAAGRNPETLYRTTRGNPFFVSELLNGQDDTVPRSVQDAILVRADRLDGPARHVLDTVSIFPRRAETGVLKAICGEAFGDGLDLCLSSGLLQVDGAFVAFRHELARQAVEMSLSWSARSILHGKALELLSLQSGVQNSVLLHHARQSTDQASVGVLARKAAIEAENLSSNREAVEYYRVAIETSRDLLQSDAAELFEKCAWCSYLVGNQSQAIDMQTRALDLYHAFNDPVAEGRGFRKLSRYQWTGLLSPEAAERSAQRAVKILSDFPGPDLAMAQSTLSQLEMLSWNLGPAIEHAEQAIAYARANDRKDILSNACNNLGVSLSWADPVRSASLMHQSIQLATEIRDWDSVVRGYLNWSEAEFRNLNFERGCALAEAGLSVCIEHQLDGYILYVSGLHAWNLLALGQWEAAAGKVAETGLKPSSGGENSQMYFPAGIAFIQLMSRTGKGSDPRVEAAISHAGKFVDAAQHMWIYAVALAERAWMGLGDIDDAIALLERTLDMVAEPRMVPHVLVWLHRLSPERELDGINSLQPPFRYLLSGDWKASATDWAERDAPYDQALALAEGDEAACNQALEILGGLGAVAVAARVREDMKRRGMGVARRGPRGSTKTNPKGLTSRQMDVLVLLDKGLSNAQIAERLFVSPKTVDHHVSAILGKLDATTRGEAAAIARSDGMI